MRFAEVRYILAFIFFALFQGVVFKHIILFDYAFCFIYIYYLLGLPVDLRPIAAIFIGFAMGLAVDFFYDTVGIHASASVLIMFLREKWLNAIIPQGGFDAGTSPSIKVSGITWYAGYAFPLILLHQLVLFYTESYGFSLFWFTLYKAILSTVFTFIMCIVLQVLFVRK